jgi:predicted dienelactone hydrolase
VPLKGTPWSPLSWTEPTSNAFDDARVVEGDESFPVIVFSHGNGNNAIDHAYLLEALASYGYIVAAPDHLNDTQDDSRIDFINGLAGAPVLPCFDGAKWPSLCAHTSVSESMIERFHDVQAILDTLPSWFGHRVDMDRVGMMGHSRGSVTTLAVAGGSTDLGFSALTGEDGRPRIKALLVLSIGTADVASHVNFQGITVPTLLLSGDLEPAPLQAESKAAFMAIASTDKQRLVIHNATHRHFDSAFCAQVQSSASIAQADSNAILDLRSANQILWNSSAPIQGAAVDLCGYDSFTTPTNIIPFVNLFYATAATTKPPPPQPLPGFKVTSTDVPTHGLTTAMVKDQVISLARCFFGQTLNRADGDDRPFSDFLPDEFKNQPPVPDPTQQDLDAAALHADDPD